MTGPQPPARLTTRLPFTVKAAAIIWILAAVAKFTMAIILLTLGRSERVPTGAAVQMMLGVVLFYMARRTIGALERDLLGLIAVSAVMGLVNAWSGHRARTAAEIAVLVQGAALLLAAALALIGRSGYKVLHEQLGHRHDGHDQGVDLRHRCARLLRDSPTLPQDSVIADAWASLSNSGRAHGYPDGRDDSVRESGGHRSAASGHLGAMS